VLGNPPYSGHSANTGVWISNLLRGNDTSSGQKTGNYFEVDDQPLGEKNPKWLNDDYVKFIRFAQWRIEQTGYGILAFISNHGYLDNPTFRGMRQSLMQTFDDIYILDLHGNSKKKERCPDGSEDKNVFDIQQGVAIGIFIKRTSSKTGLATVRHSDLWGKRELFEKTNDENKLVGGKYHWLAENETKTTSWSQLQPQSPMYLFLPQDMSMKMEFDKYFNIAEIFQVNNVGIVTARDELTIHFSRELAWTTVCDFAGLSEEKAREKYNLGIDTRDWKVNFAQNDLKKSGLSKNKIAPILYRPFDNRYTYYTGHSRGFHCRPRGDLMRHILAGKNLNLIFMRQVVLQAIYSHFLVTDHIVDNRAFYSNKGIMNLAPLYLYKTDKTNGMLFEDSFATENRKHNLSPQFINDFAARLKMQFIPDGKGDIKKTFGPEDIFSYMYAVFHSPTYRSRYAEFLKMDFPRLPLTSHTELFRKLCALGDELVSFHLMEKQGKKITSYPAAGDSAVETVRYTEPQCEVRGRVWINATQYFDGVPKEVWEFHVGGYQVCAKWLKDRKRRKLTYDDLTHYQQIISALAETIKLMEDIDATITASGGWPIA